MRPVLEVVDCRSLAAAARRGARSLAPALQLLAVAAPQGRAADTDRRGDVLGARPFVDAPRDRLPELGVVALTESVELSQDQVVHILGIDAGGRR